MPIKRTSDRVQIKAWVDRQVDLFLSFVEQAIHNAGLNAVTTSRTTHKYKDQTGNLTSSVGYVIVKAGQIVKSDFTVADAGTDKVTGKAKGEEYARKVAAECPTGMQLVIVAGMPYAVYVEAMGLDVLDSAIIQATQETKQKINDIVKKWQR